MVASKVIFYEVWVHESPPENISDVEPNGIELIGNGTLCPLAMLFLSSLLGRGGYCCLSFREWCFDLRGRWLVLSRFWTGEASRFSPASTIT